MVRNFKYLATLIVVIFSIQTILVTGSHAQVGQEIRGQLEAIISDDFENHKHEVKYFIKDLQSQRRLELKGANKRLRDIMPGSKIRVRGNMGSAGDINAENVLVEELAESVSSETVAAAATNRKVLMIKVNFSDRANPCGSSYFNDVIDGATNSVGTLFEETNKGRFGMVSTLAPEVTIPASYTESACSYSSWASQARAELSNLGFSVSGYDHIVYHYPKSNGCSYAGQGNLNGPNSWIYGTCARDVLAHELGHNLGMHHAGRGTNEYNDRSDIMGYGGIGLRQVNGPRMIRQGWIDSSQYQDGGIGTYDLAPLELSTTEAAGKLQVLVYNDAVDANLTWYISYRQRIGYDSILSAEHIGGINIHNSTSGGYRTNFVKALVDGETYSDPNGTFTITQSSHDINGVRFSVNANCMHQNPSISISPVSIKSSPGSTEAISINVANNDSSICGSSSFNLSSSLSAGLQLMNLPTSVTLNAGESQVIQANLQLDSALGDGNYSASVSIANSNDVAIMASGSVTVSVDSTAPSIPMNLVGSSERKGIALSWSASSDQDSNITYIVLRNGQPIGTTTNPSYRDTAVSSGLSYVYSIQARDSSGNTSAESASVTVTYSSGGKKGGGKGGNDDGSGGGGPPPGKGKNK